MREIKYRVWTGDTMLQVVKLNLLKRPNGEYMELGQGYFLNGLRKGENVKFSMNSVKFLEYTGLKDKSGTEIYEGDILNRNLHWGFYVGFKDGCFVSSPLETVQRNNWEHPPLKNLDFRHWEVIGNVYENPELIK